MRAYLALFGCVLMACLSFLCVQSAMAIRAARIDLFPKAADTLAKADGALADIHSIEVETQRTEAEMAGLLNQSRHAMLTEAQKDALAGNMARLLQDSDESVRKLGIAAQALGEVAPHADVAIEGIETKSSAALDSFGDTMRAAKADLDSSELRDSMVQVDDAAKSAAVGMAAAADSMADLKRGMHYEVEQLMKPVRKIEAAALVSARLAGRFLGF